MEGLRLVIYSHITGFDGFIDVVSLILLQEGAYFSLMTAVLSRDDITR